MDASVQCEVCLNDYHKETCVPKSLDCGHSICDKCLASILQNQRKCPECRATLTRSTGEYPTNFGLLRVAITMKEKSHVDCLKALTVDSMKKELTSKKNTMEKLMDEIEKMTCSLKTNKTSTQMLLSYTTRLFDADQIEDFVPEVKECLKKVNRSLNCSWETDKDLLRLKDFENSKLFLRDVGTFSSFKRFSQQIIDRLQKGEKLYAFEMVNSTPKFGKITSNNNRINIHTLDMSSVDQSALIVPFSEFKKCFKEDCFRTFMKIGEEMISFSIHDSSYLALQFIKICSGEAGFTFKGVHFSKNKGGSWEGLRIENYMRLDYGDEVSVTKNGSEAQVLTEATKLFNDYDLNNLCTQKVTSRYDGNQLVVQMFCNGVCVLSKWIGVGDVHLENVVAICPQPSFSLSEIDSNVITDCGISLIVKSV